MTDAPSYVQTIDKMNTDRIIVTGKPRSDRRDWSLWLWVASHPAKVWHLAYQSQLTRSTPQPVQNLRHMVRGGFSFGTTGPEGEVIQVFAPTSAEGHSRGSQRYSRAGTKGDVIAATGYPARRLATFQEAQGTGIAQAQLSQVEGRCESRTNSGTGAVDRQQLELQTETEAQEAAISRLQAELQCGAEARRWVLYSEGAVSASLPGW